MPAPAVIYARISADRAGAGLGVDRQEQDCRQLADRLDLDVTAVYTDNDLSAYSGKPRPGFHALLEQARAGQVGTILVWHMDRLVRLTRELEDIADLCQQYDITVRTVTAGDVDMTTASGRMVARIVGATSRHEVEHAQERMRRAKEQVRAQGRWQGGRRPFGYDADGMTVRESEAAVIRDATARILAGQSVRGLAARLNDAKVRTATGGTWSGVTVRAVLIRARNAGLLEHAPEPGRPREVVGPAAWPAIVSEDEWRAVKTLLTDPGRVTTYIRGRRFLGSGLFVCGMEGCGSVALITSTSRRGRTETPYVYRCRATRAHVSIAAEHVDARVNDTMRALLAKPGAAARLTPAATVDEVAELRAELTAVRTRLEQLADSFADGGLGFDPAQTLRANTRLNARRQQLEDRLAALARRDAVSRLVTSTDLAETWDSLTVDERRPVIHALAVVRLMPAQRLGRLPGGGYFDESRVRVEAR